MTPASTIPVCVYGRVDEHGHYVFVGHSDAQEEHLRVVVDDLWADAAPGEESYVVAYLWLKGVAPVPPFEADGLQFALARGQVREAVWYLTDSHQDTVRAFLQAVADGRWGGSPDLHRRALALLTVTEGASAEPPPDPNQMDMWADERPVPDHNDVKSPMFRGREEGE